MGRMGDQSVNAPTTPKKEPKPLWFQGWMHWWVPILCLACVGLFVLWILMMLSLPDGVVVP
jgi:hypothetical protein